MSSDCSHKEFVIWSVIPTGCNDIKEILSPDQMYDLLLNPPHRKSVAFVCVDGMSR